eukprot:g4666.t1
METEGVFCSTAGSVFKDKKAFTEHYKSEFHLYNLKRRVAGLPPVSREWFEERKKQLIATALSKKPQQIWTEPLTKKKFQSEATYNAFIASKKYKSILKQNNLPTPPDPVTTSKPVKKNEVVAEKEVDVAVEWDVTVSLFDNHKSDTIEENVQYMFVKFGFLIPHSEYLIDTGGLIQYLGAKLSQGYIPLYCSGLNPNTRQFKSLKAVQSHMIDICKCTMLFDGNEEEYEEFYDLEKLLNERSGLDLQDQEGFELLVNDLKSDKEKILGNREFWYLYRQRHGTFSSGVVMIPDESRRWPFIKESIPVEISRSQKQESNRRSWNQLKTELRSNVNNNLPRNVPY